MGMPVVELAEVLPPPNSMLTPGATAALPEAVCAHAPDALNIAASASRHTAAKLARILRKLRCFVTGARSSVQFSARTQAVIVAVEATGFASVVAVAQRIIKAHFSTNFAMYLYKSPEPALPGDEGSSMHTEQLRPDAHPGRTYSVEEREENNSHSDRM
jgi:hypothetical protein